MITARFVFLLSAVLAFPAIAAAQLPGMSPWWDKPVARDLGLSEEQNRQIRTIVRESRDRLIQLRAAVDSAEAEARDEMNEDKVDAKKVEAAIDKVAGARAELIRAVSRMGLKLRLILTPAQWQELQKREAQQPPPPRDPPKKDDRRDPPPRRPPPDDKGEERPDSPSVNQESAF